MRILALFFSLVVGISVAQAEEIHWGQEIVDVFDVIREDHFTDHPEGDHDCPCKKMGLSEAQKNQIRTAAIAHRAEMEALFDIAKGNMRQYFIVLANAETSRSQADAAQAEVGETFMTIGNVHGRFFHDVAYDIVTPTQRPIFLLCVKHKVEEFKEHRKKRFCENKEVQNPNRGGNDPRSGHRH